MCSGLAVGRGPPVVAVVDNAVGAEIELSIGVLVTPEIFTSGVTGAGIGVVIVESALSAGVAVVGRPDITDDIDAFVGTVENRTGKSSDGNNAPIGLIGIATARSAGRRACIQHTDRNAGGRPVADVGAIGLCNCGLRHGDRSSGRLDVYRAARIRDNVAGIGLDDISGRKDSDITAVSLDSRVDRNPPGRGVEENVAGTRDVDTAVVTVAAVVDDDARVRIDDDSGIIIQ